MCLRRHLLHAGRIASMAKKEKENDDDKVELDEDLKEGLKGAKKGPRNFILIAKGSKVVKFIVQKKKVPAGDASNAKAEFGGNLVVRGVCTRNGKDLVLQVLEEPS